LGRETLLKAMADARQQAANENVDNSGGEEDEEPITQEQLNKLSAKVSRFGAILRQSRHYVCLVRSPWCRALCHWCFCACFQCFGHFCWQQHVPLRHYLSIIFLQTDYDSIWVFVRLCCVLYFGLFVLFWLLQIPKQEI
jgi:hypothetical protein